jgi:hypothetical protein
MLMYLGYYLIGYFITFILLAIVNSYKEDPTTITANMAVLASMFWPLLVPFAIIGTLHNFLKIIFEAISKP